ncbi:MAG: pirin family protein [Christensenellales bacterium]
MERKVLQKVRGQKAIDGAGVHLTRVLGRDTVQAFDPFLMLDSFDSKNPSDYIAGFPTHPHRGIETITYLIEGRIDHEDSLGNAGVIRAGQSQWMTAGNGILHQEMPQPSERMLGTQLWLNLPAKDKMAAPHYFDITQHMIGVVKEENAVVRVIAGEYKGTKGVTPPFIQASYYDIELHEGAAIRLDTKADETAFIFLIEGDALIEQQRVPEKTAVLFTKGDYLSIAAPQGQKLRFLFHSARPLRESVAWGGPIVMNTQEELQQAFAELKAGTFISHA